MPLIRPFAGLRPAPEYAQEVAAPPYDVLSSDEARARAAGKPRSFLRVSKPEIDLSPHTDAYAPEVYAKGKENFTRMLAQGILRRDTEPCYYLYRLVMGTHIQTGLAATVSVADYKSNRIRKHEFTHPDKEDDRLRHMDGLNAQTGPVFLTYRHSPEIDALAAFIIEGPPDTDISLDNVRHSLWVIRDRKLIVAFSQAFSKTDYFYIADGHHRSAAAARLAENRVASHPGQTGPDAYHYFLAVIFPDNQTQILDYNRLVRDLNGLSEKEFLGRLHKTFVIAPENKPVKPGRVGEFGMYLAGQWYRLSIKRERVPAADPVQRLDVSLLQDNLLTPILAIGDPRHDKRIDFVGGIRGLAELERRVLSCEMAAAFSLYPTTLADLMAVADAGSVMPPKSTWFEPKLADGLLSHVLD
ncbi:MAG TPA: DUF1015 family protein [Acidiferrobacterales bacterium]|nr:DUF1015 family protein [Acidiferrobacterales bacterium]